MRTLKRVIVINDFDFVNGGTSQIAISTANLLARAGYSVTFFSAVHDASRHDLDPSVDRHSTGQLDILHEPNKLKAALDGIWNAKAEKALEQLLGGFSAEDTVIHLHGWIKALSPSIGRVLSKTAIPSICTLHDYFVACPNGGFFIFPTNTICHLEPMSLSCICTNCDARSYWQKLWRVARQGIQLTLGAIPRGMKNFITVSTFSRRILEPYLPDQARVFNIPNPVNYPFDPPRRCDTNAARFLVVGRLSAEKGIGLACEAAKQVQVPLTVIGDGPLRGELQEQYPHVTFKGWMDQVDIFHEMLSARALVFPSLLYETQGLSVLEALSVGLPIIVADKSAASDFVHEGNGLLFQSGKVSNLSQQMQRLFESRELAADLSQTAFESYWKAPFTSASYLKKLISAYLSL